MAAAAVDSPLEHSFENGLLPTKLRANRGTIHQDRLGWLKPTPYEVRERLEHDGYVWIKGLLPREDVLEMRRHFFSQFDGTGLLKPGTSHVDGIYNSNDDVTIHRGVGGGNPAGEEELRRLTEAHTTEGYEKFTSHDRLRGMVRDIMGWKQEVMLQRTLLRHSVPGGDSTGIHYDRLFLRGGEAYFLTAWVPIGDISSTGGGLYYLHDSVSLGEAMEKDYSERAKDFAPEQKINAFNQNMGATGYLADHPDHFTSEHDLVAKKEGWSQDRYKWLVGEFEAGDVILHHPSMIHGSCGNDDPEGKIRLSTDLRFYDKADFDRGAADNRWTKYWHVNDQL
ncbi:uncharacterized protein LTR77_005879 [Saxophila tyrrhenica]|uniref:Phytanoyl-CoA dioxygenase n=1 Tax=Saxophila tyrrhenica TaxID=1690608 RepID=A0AAV9P9Z3_9PEZI|nr:hypothetical protein LTR77_005879 [Saxophila tyrrhenica]